ncbi:MAG: 30S ribosomal protein S21 [Candidatus Paceibacterota bacterium]|jgi:hypothetical protein
MSVKVQRQKQESSQSLIYRFNQAIQKSGVLVEVRKRKFVKRAKSKNLQKEAAVIREAKKKEYQRLRKLGKIVKKARRR